MQGQGDLPHNLPWPNSSISSSRLVAAGLPEYQRLRYRIAKGGLTQVQSSLQDVGCSATGLGSSRMNQVNTTEAYLTAPKSRKSNNETFTKTFTMSLA